MKHCGGLERPSTDVLLYFSAALPPSGRIANIYDVTDEAFYWSALED